MGQDKPPPGQDEQALLDLLPADGNPADNGEIQRDLTAVPPEFRPACGRPGARVIVRQVPVTVPHALCDLTGVIVSYPGHGGMTVPAPGHATGNSKSMRVQVDARTRDVTV